MADYTLCGKELQSPFIVGSGPLSYDAHGIVRLHQAGAGAVVTKTIRAEACVNPLPHMVQNVPNALINCEKWSDLPPEAWMEQEIPAAKAAGAVVIASVGQTLAESSGLVEQVEQAGADFIELVSYESKDLVPMLKDAKKKVHIPVIVKLSPNYGDLLEVARECMQNGADAFTACDSLGPALRIDVETGKPLLAGTDGFGWLSGAVIKPVTLARIAMLRQICSIPIIGLGGVVTAKDAVEMAMVGADLVGVCSAIILKGPAYLTKLNRDLEQFLQQHGHTALGDVTGAALPHLPKEDCTGKLTFSYDAQKCTLCGRCTCVCCYEARTLSKERDMRLDTEKCRYCGLCASVCATGALTVDGENNRV